MKKVFAFNVRLTKDLKTNINAFKIFVIKIQYYNQMVTVRNVEYMTKKWINILAKR